MTMGRRDEDSRPDDINTHRCQQEVTIAILAKSMAEVEKTVTKEADRTEIFRNDIYLAIKGSHESPGLATRLSLVEGFVREEREKNDDFRKDIRAAVEGTPEAPGIKTRVAIVEKGQNRSWWWLGFISVAIIGAAITMISRGVGG